jgi:plastocyanin
MRRLTIRSMLTLAAVAVTALALVQIASARTEPQARASATTIHVSGKEFSFHLSKKSIGRPAKVTFVFTNVGTVTHDFSINGKKTPMIRPHKTASVAVTFRRKGKYRYLCTVPGHAAAGMKGVFTVR